MKPISKFQVESSRPPTVEIDTSACAAYIRFSSAKISRTISEDKPGPVIAIDLDANGRVVGVELIGVKEFSIQRLIRFLPPITSRTGDIHWDRTRYVRSGHCDFAPA